MDDLISRQQAISRAVEFRMFDRPVKMVAVSELEALPPAQAEERTDERTETHACDCISRQAAIDAVDAVFPVDPVKSEYAQGIACGAALAKIYVEQLPSVQPETEERTAESAQNVPNDDLISRKMAIEELRAEFKHIPTTAIRAMERLKGLPSAQPEHFDEWCTDCKEYDHERHSCPRWNRVIRETLKDAQPEQSYTSEFWRKRAVFYSDMCMNLIGEMGKGVKIESVKISENGIAFIKEQPPTQPEIIHCEECKYAKENQGELWICAHPDNNAWHIFDDFYCGRAERKEE